MNHVEPDRSASLEELIMRHPEAKGSRQQEDQAMVSNVTWDVDEVFRNPRKATSYVRGRTPLHGFLWFTGQR